MVDSWYGGNARLCFHIFHVFWRKKITLNEKRQQTEKGGQKNKSRKSNAALANPWQVEKLLTSISFIISFHFCLYSLPSEIILALNTLWNFLNYKYFNTYIRTYIHTVVVNLRKNSYSDVFFEVLYSAKGSFINIFHTFL
jgi:hypothetical protein